MKNPLIIAFLARVLRAIPCLANAQSPDKIDNELQQVLNTAKPSDLISIIIVFQDKPIEEAILSIVNARLREIGRSQISKIALCREQLKGKRLVKALDDLCYENSGVHIKDFLPKSELSMGPPL